ncbi:MAG: hypothetical protein PHV78_01910 [Patescibacteria group bacterium]|nr:hypothetical protein [Patescibacteria group bacterium]MDD5121095.1 hypothetical protein [Patescibacteria group bacterium]MDD5221933.1 hypothetical protein [Patescibacteria group bacterium]MDD5395986.1 hypothetical protein [Patescibacteria group bacterium]
MNTNKWEEIIYLIEEKFGIDAKSEEDFLVEETHDGRKITGRKEVVEFTGPMGKTRIEKISQPKLVDKKVLSNKRIGGKAVIDYVFSDNEVSERVNFYRFDDAAGNWIEIKNII